MIDNGDTSLEAEFTTTTTNEQYLLGAFSAAIELFMPDLRIEKSVENVSRPGQDAWPGDTLEYTIEVRNGDDPADVIDTATDVVIRDAIPAGTTYVPGTLRMVSGEPAPTGPRTDASADDSAEHDAVLNEARFRVGSGAGASDGGSLAAGDSAVVSFRVTVNADHPGGVIANTATADYVAETLDEPFSSQDDADYPVEPTADLEIEKRPATKGKPVPGKLYTYELEVTNNGPVTTTATVVDVLPNKVEYASHSGAICSVALPEISCDVGPLASGESIVIRVRVRVTPTPRARSPTPPR